MNGPRPIVCIHCGKRRPASEEPCPSCGGPPMRHKQTAEEFQQRQRDIEAADRLARRLTDKS